MPIKAGAHINCNGVTHSGGWFDCSSTPQELAVTTPQSSCNEYVDKYATLYGVNATLMRRIIQAESGGNPYAKNSVSTASGCAQFTRATYTEYFQRTGEEWVSPFNAETNVKALAWFISQGEIRRWNASKHNWK